MQEPNGSAFRTLVNNVRQPASPYTVEWDGRDATGALASVEGAYRVRLTATEPGSSAGVERVGTIVVYR